MRGPTSSQILQLLQLLDRLHTDFNGGTLTEPVIDSLGIDKAWQGMTLNAWLRSLTDESASDIISKHTKRIVRGQRSEA